MESGVALEAVVTEQGLVVPPDQLDKIGAHPGDRVVVNLQPRKAPRSMMGFGKAKTDFTLDDQREIRREIGKFIGDDLTR